MVHVEDLNDNAPVFKQSTYRLKVLENEVVGYELLIIQADDSDLNSKIHYKIDDDNNTQLGNITQLLEINSKTGALKLLGQLDYEHVKKLSFSVEAIDNGNPPLSSKCFVEIDVLDVNDNAPKFVKALYEVDLRENIVVGTKVLQVIFLFNI